VTTAIQANFADAAIVFPALKEASVEIADADHLETLSIDNVPVIDMVPGTSNAIYATAWCGHGWAIAPAITQMLADWATTRRKPELLAPFTHNRFQS
ncbi:MAG: FAD-dependent oxidoreductase, partial [Pseudomonadota bacterium]